MYRARLGLLYSLPLNAWRGMGLLLLLLNTFQLCYSTKLSDFVREWSFENRTRFGPIWYGLNEFTILTSETLSDWLIILFVVVL